jgi:hypothetical protein
MTKQYEVGLNDIVEQNKDLLSSELDNDTVLMSVTQSSYFGLDATAQQIWNMIDQPRRVADLCEQLLEEYDVDSATCEQRVCTFLTEMNKEGLIRVSVEDGS